MKPKIRRFRELDEISPAQGSRLEAVSLPGGRVVGLIDFTSRMIWLSKRLRLEVFYILKFQCESRLRDFLTVKCEMKGLSPHEIALLKAWRSDENDSRFAYCEFHGKLDTRQRDFLRAAVDMVLAGEKFPEVEDLLEDLRERETF